MVAGDRLMKRERLEVGARLVPWIVGRQVVDARPAAVLGGRIPLPNALALAKRRVGRDHQRRPGQPPEPLRNRGPPARHPPPARPPPPFPPLPGETPLRPRPPPPPS